MDIDLYCLPFLMLYMFDISGQNVKSYKMCIIINFQQNVITLLDSLQNMGNFWKIMKRMIHRNLNTAWEGSAVVI
jgi:hypothetical protein